MKIFEKLFLGVIAVSTINQPAHADIKSNFEKSFQAWSEAKVTNNDSYEFAHSFQSWVGFSNRTVITVREGKVVSRKFFEKDRDAETESLTYSEDEDNLGKDPRGHAAISMDQVYSNCRMNVINSQNEHQEHYFEMSDSGILSTCGFRDKRCADDCFNGVRVSSFRWLPKD